MKPFKSLFPRQQTESDEIYLPNVILTLTWKDALYILWHVSGQNAFQKEMFDAIRKGEVLAKQFATNGYAGKDALAGAHRENAILMLDTEQAEQAASKPGIFGTVPL